MKPAIWSVAAILAIVLCCVASGQVASDAPVNTVRISAHIQDWAGAALRNETFTLKVNGREEGVSTKTDQNGVFVFPQVRGNQQYELWVGPRYLMRVDVGEADIDMGVIGTDLNRPVHISGRFLDYMGMVMRKEAITLTGDGGLSVATQTDQNGDFSFSSVQPNRHYSLQATPTEFGSTLIEVEVEDRNVEMGNIVIQPPSPLSLTSGPGSVKPPILADRTTLLSGRVTDASGVPFAEKILTFRNVKMGVPFQTQQGWAISTLKTDRNGMFFFPAVSPVEYELEIPVRCWPPSFQQIAEIEVVDGWDVGLGNIVVEVSSRHQPFGTLVGPAMVKDVLPAAQRREASVQSVKPSLIAGVFIGAGGIINVVRGDGKVVHQPKEKDQVGCSSPLISEDKQAVGWLVDSDFCCTSYPIQPMLVIYKPGKPLQHLTGDGRAIFQWQFVGGGKQVAFYQDFLHGTPGQHYELRDVETGSLVGKWDGEITAKAPRWVQGLK